MYEINIPGHKVGLIIGKGGATIKQLEKQTGAKIDIIQDNAQAAKEKPLRINGSVESIEEAKQLVIEILSQSDYRDMQFGSRGRGHGQGRGGFPIRGGPGGGGDRDGNGGATAVEKRFEDSSPHLSGQPAALGRGQKRAQSAQKRDQSKSCDESATEPLPCYALAQDSKLQELELENLVLKKEVEDLKAELVRSKASEFEPNLKSLYVVLNNLEERQDCNTKATCREPSADALTKQNRTEVLEHLRQLLHYKVDSKIRTSSQDLEEALEIYMSYLAQECLETEPKLKQERAATVQEARDCFRAIIDNHFQTIPWDKIRATTAKLTLALAPFDLEKVDAVRVNANAIAKMLNTIIQNGDSGFDDTEDKSPHPKRTKEAVKKLTEKLAEVSDKLQTRDSVISKLGLKHLTRVALKTANAEYEHHKSGNGEFTDADSRFKEFLPALKTAHLKLTKICHDYDRVVKMSLHLQPDEEVAGVQKSDKAEEECPGNESLEIQGIFQDVRGEFSDTFEDAKE